MMDPMRALEKIWDIVHTPTKKTSYRDATAHFQSDFDEIRNTIRPFYEAGYMRQSTTEPKP